MNFVVVVVVVVAVLCDKSYSYDASLFTEKELNRMSEFLQYMRYATGDELPEYSKGMTVDSLKRQGGPVPLDPINFAKSCAGWTAQTMCSGVFGAGIPEEVVSREDVAFIGYISADYTIDYEEKSVIGICKLTPGCCTPANYSMKTIWRQGIGCTSVEEGMTEDALRQQDTGNQEPPTPLNTSIPWPFGEGYFPENSPVGVDRECLARVSQANFDAPLINTRAIVVSFRDYLVFEQYRSPHITKDTRLLGWSATKSLTGTLVGIAAAEGGGLNIYAPANVSEWYEEEGDGRQEITPDMMLRMSSGTQWHVDLYATTECLYYGDGNCAHTSALQPLLEEPDTVWKYNSGSSYILSRIALEQRNSPQWNNFEWPKQKLFYPIGAHSAYIEYQQNQIYLGGSYGYLTGRDWTRFGLLYARDGVWVDGSQVLPLGWAEYARTATHTNEEYAGHFWKIPSIDPEMHYASGFRNENVYIFPSKQLVITRMAMPLPVAYPAYAFNQNEFLNNMLECFDFDAN